MPDSIELSKGQSHVIAKGDWIQIDDTTALIYPLRNTTREVSVSLIGFGSLPGLSVFITNLITSIVGPGNASVTLDTATSTLTVAFASNVTKVQIANVQNLLSRMLPKNLTVEVDPLPTDYIRAEFLESTGTQYIYLEHELTNRVACSFTITPTEIYNNSYFCGRNERAYVRTAIVNDDELAVNQVQASGYIRVEASTKKVYNIELNVLKRRGILRCGEEETAIQFNVPTLTLVPRALIFWGGQASTDKSSDKVSYLSHARMSDISVSHNGVPTHTFISSLDPTGVPCLYDTVSKQPFYNAGTGQFIVGFDTAEQALKLATLPDVTDATKKSLTVSLPGEAQLASTGVPAALQVAAARGWTIITQYRED